MHPARTTPNMDQDFTHPARTTPNTDQDLTHQARIRLHTMTIHLKPLLSILAAFLIVAGCDTVNEDPDPPRGVVVANQGNFGDGNGSVSTYDPVSGAVEAAAIGSLGSIVQSLLLSDTSLYVMANTGSRVDVFDARSYERTAQIPDVVSPRYMLADGSSGFVTSLFGAEGSFTGGLVTVLDLDSMTKVDEIGVGDNPEGLALVESRLHVANHGFGEGSTVSVVDVAAREVVETIDVECDGPRFLVADAEEEVFVFCTGRTIYDDEFNPIGETDGAIRVLDGRTGAILARIDVDGRIGTVGPGQDAYHASDENAVFVVKDERSVLVIDTQTNSLAEELGPFDGQPLSAVAYDDRSDRIYLGRSRGFTQAGEVSIHDRSGAEIDRFTAGVVPTYISFDPAGP